MSTLDQTRLYVVKATDNGRKRLVNAPTKARAQRYATVVHVASPREVAELLQAGVKPENVDAPQQGAQSA